MVKKRTKSFRTTLSIDGEYEAKLEHLAEVRGISVGEVIRTAVRHYLESEQATQSGRSSATEQARKLIEISRGLNNPYQKLVGSWRLSRTERQLSDIAGLRVELDVWPAEIYLLRVLTELLQKFGPHDEFLVVTNLQFWHDAASPSPSSFFGPESAGLYLSAQGEAIARGMRLHRVFLLSDEDLRLRTCGLKQHRRFVTDLRKHYPQHSEHVQVRYKSFPSIDDARMRIGHFACIRWRNTPGTSLPASEPDEGCLIVEPVYYAPGKISHLRLLFSNGPSHTDPVVKFYLDRFLQAADGSEPVENIVANPLPPAGSVVDAGTIP